MKLFSSDPIEDDLQIPASALALGLAGLIPFVVGGLFAINSGAGIVTPEGADFFLISYAAIILSYMAGVRWGTALFERDKGDQSVQLVVSVIPSIIGWFCLFLPFFAALPLLAFLHAALGVWDIRAMYNGHGPFWYAKLRLLLAFLVVALLLFVGLIRYFNISFAFQV